MLDKAPTDNWRDQALVSLMNSYLHQGKTDEALTVNERRREMAEKGRRHPAAHRRPRQRRFHPRRGGQAGRGGQTPRDGR
ncbi:MAG: hypothetical protein ABR543_09630 [Gemmatimonadaceae bacterium]